MNFSYSMASRRTGHTGFSLIEFMVALLLGLIITTGAVSVYLASKRSFTEVEQVAAVSENGRFAIRLLGSSIRHVGFFGGASSFDIEVDDSAMAAVTGNCTGDAAVYDIDNSFFAARAASSTLYTCITDALPGTDVLVIKSVDPNPIHDANPDDPNEPRDGVLNFVRVLVPPGTEDDPWNTEETYVIANSEGGALIDGVDTPRPTVDDGAAYPLAAAWPYRFQIFYVRNSADGIPTLSRKYLRWDAGGMAIVTEDLVEGVENIRYRFGVDSDNNGEVDSFVDTLSMTANDWEDVTSLQAFILIRTELEDLAYSNEKTYTIGNVTITPQDNFRRILLYSELTLRNPRLFLRGGA